MSIVKEEHKVALRKWHEELQDKRGERASLRRSTTVNDVCMTDGFRAIDERQPFAAQLAAVMIEQVIALLAPAEDPL